MSNTIMPKHVAIILDGNRRWAKQRNLPSLKGHQKGFENIRDLAPYIFDRGVEVLSVYAFSEQNFNRSVEEVGYLMDLFIKEFKKEYKKLHEENIKIVFSSRESLLRDDVREAMNEIVELTKNNTKGIFNICLSYSGQQEVCEMTKKICELYKNGEVELDDITPEFVQKNLYQDLPPVDLMIRTSGEYRLSNFMMYQCSYAEFYFPQIMFPDFNRDEFDKAVEEFNNRNRRFGGN